MRVIAPAMIGEAALVSSSVPEPDTGETAWSAATAYAVGDRAYRPGTHRVYRRLKAGTTEAPPENDTENWTEIGGTNRWAMFDDQTGSATIEVTPPLDVTIAPGRVTALGFFELVGDTLAIEVRDGPGGAVVYSRSITLSLTTITDWFGYWYEPFRQLASVVLTDLPPYDMAQIRVLLGGGSTVRCGVMVAGTVYDLGETLTGVSAGIRDYSRKEVDAATGITRIQQRRFAKTLRARLRVDPGAIDAVHQVLTELRGTPAVWIADEGERAALQVYGFYKDFSLDCAFRAVSFYTLEIEGMT